MRVALLTTNLARGGAETQVAQLATRLRGRGHEVGVFSLIKPTAFEQELRSAGVRVDRPFAIRGFRPHILHCHMFHANILGRLLRLVCPVPVVISTLHSLAESSRRSDKIRGRDLLYRVTDCLADLTVAVSQAAAERHVAARAVPASRIRVIPNGVDTGVFHPAPQREPNAEFTWLAVGRLMWKKDYPTLLAAFAQLGRGRLLIAGTGPDEAELRRTAPPGVEFLGVRTDIPELLRAADGFVMSSVVEGLPVALLEAAASGLPAVATDVGGVRETGVAILVPPRDPPALAAAMKRVMDREVAATPLASRFTLEQVTSEWEALYAELLERTRWT
jgi:glycosyltransferase involved in cell wall biosynthesis